MMLAFSSLCILGFFMGIMIRLVLDQIGGQRQAPKGYGKPDPEFFRLMKAAKAGDPQSQFLMGMTFAEGMGVRPDQEQAVFWYQKAAEQNHAAAQYHLGVLYREGHGVARDENKAGELFARAAEKGYSPSAESLGYQDPQGEVVE